MLGGQRVDLADLASRTLVTGGRELGSGWPVALPELRSVLAEHSRWATAITQGDVTEPNITEPLCWLDFEHAGRNVLAADIANFLWYLLGMGGWLVPAYQADVYKRTLRAPVPPVAVPAVDHLRVTSRHVEIDYTWHVDPGRHAALCTLLCLGWPVTLALHWHRVAMEQPACGRSWRSASSVSSPCVR